MSAETKKRHGETSRHRELKVSIGGHRRLSVWFSAQRTSGANDAYCLRFGSQITSEYDPERTMRSYVTLTINNRPEPICSHAFGNAEVCAKVRFVRIGKIRCRQPIQMN